MLRRDLLPDRRLDAEALAEDREHRRGLHLSDPGQPEEPPAQVGAALRLGPDPLRAAAVLALDRGAQLLRSACHRAGVAVKRRLPREALLELARAQPRDPRRVEPAEPPLELQRPAERLLERHL